MAVVVAQLYIDDNKEKDLFDASPAQIETEQEQKKCHEL